MIKRRRGYLEVRNEPVSPATQQLEAEGYTVIAGVFSSAEVRTLQQQINDVFAHRPADHRSARSPEAAEMFRYGMYNHSAAAQQAVANRGILDVIEPLLGEDCHVIANTAWRNPPAVAGQHGGEHWHIDAGPHIPLADGVTWPEHIPHPVFAIGVHIYLEPCGMLDGPTGVLPGSHLSGRFPPPDRTMDDHLEYQGQTVVPLLAQPGDVGFFVSDIWHRRMPTQPGDRGRFFLQVHYGRRDIAQRVFTTDEVNHVTSEAAARAKNPRDKTVIGLHAPFFYDG